MRRNLNDRFSFQNRQPIFGPEAAVEKSGTSEGDEQPSVEDFSSGPREVPEVIGKLAAGERIEMDPQHWDLGEFVEDERSITDGASQFLADEDKK